MKVKKLLLATLITAAMGVGSTAYAEPYYGGDQSYGNHQGHQQGKHFGGKKGRSIERRVTKMAQHLGLSESQKQQIKSLMESNKASMQPLREQMRSVHQSLRQLNPASNNFLSQLNNLADQKASLDRRITVARGQHRQQIFNLLTPEQQTKMQTMKAERMQKRMERRERRQN